MSLGIPYTGSKRKLAPKILKSITDRHKGITDFYDLFGGGGAISFYAVDNYRFNVHYNELNNHIYELVKYLQQNRTLEPKFYEWVTREQFFEQINRMDADWYSGFVSTCWSFGNNSKAYLYGQEIMETKRLAHEFIVNGDLEAMKTLGVNIPELLNITDIQKRRTIFCDYIKTTNKERFDIENLERMVKIERIQNLQNLQNLQITNFSYENVVIKGENPIIYCDIPYKNTAEYKVGNFNHEKFYDWANEIDYLVYISEYNAPFEMVEMFSHRSSLSATNNAKKTIEKLFWNKKRVSYNTKLF